MRFYNNDQNTVKDIILKYSYKSDVYEKGKIFKTF